MAEAIGRRSRRMHLKAPVRKVWIHGRKAVGVELASGGKLFCDSVISTMPLPVLVMQADHDR